MKIRFKNMIVITISLMMMVGIAYGKVLESKHDLTFTGNGPAHATNPKITACQFCHTPHLPATAEFTGAPIWNRSVPSLTNYTLYGGTKHATAAGTKINDPGPASLACLSCHDGSISIAGKGLLVGADQTVKGTGVDSATGMLTSNSAAFIGTDLSKQHPVGFTVDTSKAGLDTMDTMVKVKKAKFYAAPGSSIENQMECGTCHDPHTSGISDYTPFLRLKKSTICTDCHAKM